MDITMTIEINLILCIMVFILYLMAYPKTWFAKWGEKKFGNYGKFLDVILSTFISLFFILLLLIFFK